MRGLHGELVAMQEWVKASGTRSRAVKTHLRRANMKLGVTSRSSAVKRATSLGIL